MERKAKALDDENEKIRGELKFWNEVYSQDTGMSMPLGATPSLTSPAISMPIPTPSFAPSVPNMSSQQNVPMSTPLSSPFGDFAAYSLSSPNVGYSSAAPNVQNRGFGIWNETQPIGQTSNRRDSFGSVFPGSTGTQGSGNGNGGSLGNIQSQVQRRSTTFNIDIRPKDPPIFHGKATEDVDI